MEAVSIDTLAGPARSGACAQIEALATGSSSIATGSYSKPVTRPKQNESQPLSFSRAVCCMIFKPSTPKRVQVLLAVHADRSLITNNSHSGLHVPTSTDVLSGSGYRTDQQALDLALQQRTAYMAAAAAWVQAQGMNDLTSTDNVQLVPLSNGGGRQLVDGAVNVVGGAADSNVPLMAFELLSTTAASPHGASTPSEEVHVVAASVNASVQIALQDQQRQLPDTTTVVPAALTDHEGRQQMDRAINVLMVGAAAFYATTKILTVDHDYWHGWTVYEILRYAPLHNWRAYEEGLKSNPLLAKMMISGIVYAIGDWIAQCCEGKPMLDFKRERMFRSGLVGFCLHGSLSHYYYHLCEALFPFKEWWVVPLKVAFDQTIWSGFWNSVYFVVLGLLRLESPLTIAAELKSTFCPLLTAGWKLWPFAHLITYGFVPVEQRLLWVDMVELVWVTILSMYSNEKEEARRLVNDAQSSSNHETTLGDQGIDDHHHFL